MLNLFEQLNDEVKAGPLPPTYILGLLHYKAYKAVMGNISDLLASSEISNTDWVALGIVYSSPNGVRSNELAQLMDIEQPYITVLVRKLEGRGYLKVTQSSIDKRVKVINLTNTGIKFVKKTELNLRKKIEKVSEGIHPQIIWNYLSVQKTLIKRLNKK
jgi:DNA-binding MarR family transcriptional regulator